MLTIQSRFHDYQVVEVTSLASALENPTKNSGALFLIDKMVAQHYPDIIMGLVPESQRILVEASEEAKSLDRLTPLFLDLLERGIKRDGLLVVIGGGVLQDIGCFIASVLFRGIRWELIPTTLLAQADSCIGSKSSINIGSYKNQIGTFYPPHRVFIIPDIIKTLPWDEIRSGLGEVIKLQLIAGEAEVKELMKDLEGFSSERDFRIVSKWVGRSLAVKKTYIEQDEFDRGIRNILNYGHTFGHAYESATNYGIPHGISVLLGILTATRLSVRISWISESYYMDLFKMLEPWCRPYGAVLQRCDPEYVLKAIKHDKKNTGLDVNCILTHGAGFIEKTRVDFEKDLQPVVREFLSVEARRLS